MQSTLGTIAEQVGLALVSAVSGAVPGWLAIATGVVAAASAIAAATPTPRDDRLVGKIYRVIDALALNIGRAKEVPPNRLDDAS